MDFGSIVNLKYIIGQYFVMALVLQGSVNCQYFRPDIDPVEHLFEEVVSIYNEHFTTPDSREPYFIKVHRCIEVCMGPTYWTSAKTQKEIEIVVSDLNDQTKFYKYVVYDHTSCKCDKNPKSTLHKKLVSNEVNETQFKAKLPNNPENLRNCSPSSFCSEPQPRHMPNPEGTKTVPEQRYILFYQCLPGCIATTEYVKMKTMMGHGAWKNISKPIKTDTGCWPYTKPTRRQSQKQSRAVKASLTSVNNVNTTYLTSKATQESESESDVLIYIASPKVFLAALVLSVILVSILIVDFNLCHRKKGIMYSVLNCRKDVKCPDCAERQQKVIESV